MKFVDKCSLDIVQESANKPEEYGIMPFSFHNLVYYLAGLRKPVICYMDGITGK